MRKYFVMVLTVLLIINISGCWDNRDVTELDIITAIGLDKGDEDNLEVTLRIPNPMQGGKADGGGQGGSEKKSFSVLTVQAENLLDAFQNANTTLSREIYITHLQIIIISEELARKEEISELLDFMERDREANIQAKILVSRGIKPKEILNAESEIETIGIAHLTKILERSPWISKMRDVQLFDLFKEKVTKGDEPYISQIQIAKDKETVKEDKESDQEGSKKSSLKMEDLSIEGVAIFKEGKMIGSLDPMETWSALFVEEECRSGMVTIPNPLEENKTISIKIKRSKSKKSVQEIGQRDSANPQERLLLKVQVEVNGIISHQTGSGDVTNPEMKKKVEEQAAKHIKEKIEEVIDKTQREYSADIFGFGAITHKHHLEYWKNIKDWNGFYSDLPVLVDVDFKLVGSGYINKPMESR